VDNVRLVHAYLDPRTNTTRDVIVDKVDRGRTWVDEDGNTRWNRIIKGLPSAERAEDGREVWEQIDWPEKEKTEEEDNEDDTLRITVDERTFVPSLLTPPMPVSVLDELRNKYSKYRTRFDPEFIEKKDRAAKEAEARSAIPDWMLQPSKELRERARKRAEAGRLPLPDSMSEDDFLERIGKLMVERNTGSDAAPTNA
jgi:large subunit ribosomal protein L24